MKKFIFFALIASMIISSCCQQTNEPIRVASYNIRMDTQSDSLNAWEYRKDKVNALIRFYDMDIFGTQEGFLHQLQDMARMTEYAYFGSGRDDGKTAGEHSAIFYRKDRFELLETGDFWLSETPDVPGKGWDATCCNRICSWGKLKEKSTGKTFYVFNVHFDHQGVVARQESGKLMIKKMQGDSQRQYDYLYRRFQFSSANRTDYRPLGLPERFEIYFASATLRPGRHNKQTFCQSAFPKPHRLHLCE